MKSSRIDSPSLTQASVPRLQEGCGRMDGDGSLVPLNEV